MRKNYLLLFAVLLNCYNSIAQVPQSIPYQAVVRNSSGNIVSNQSVRFRFSVHDLSPSGTIVYSEAQLTTTTTLGLANLTVGTGSVLSGSFTSINWRTGSKFLQVEIDVLGGTNYINMGTTQLGSVPYALYAGGTSSGWNITGNTGIDEYVNFIGTIDDVPLIIRVNDELAGRIDFAGQSATYYGHLAGYSGTINSTNNTAIGKSALQNNQTGDNNIAIGENALFRNVGRSENIAIGINSMHNYTNVPGPAGGCFNTAIGNSAMYGSTVLGNNVGVYNTCVGYNSLRSVSTGSSNIAIGAEVLSYNTTGEDNTVVGTYSMGSHTSSNGNTVIGAYALPAFSSGNENTGLGLGHLNGLNTGSKNLALGYGSGYGFHTGDSNVFMGYSAMTNLTTLNNSIALGSGVTITASRQARIGNQFINSIGGFANWSNVSDRRFKKDIRNDIHGLDFILKLNPVSYNMDYASINTLLGNAPADKTGDNMRHSGFIAQEVEEAASKINYEFSGVDAPKNEKDFYALRYAEFVVPMVKAMQEQQAMIDAQKKQIDEMQKAIEELKGMVQISN